MTTHVSFETAKLLKEKGFEEECLFYYNKQGELPERWESSGSSTDTDVPIYLEEFEHNFNSPYLVRDVSCSAPTIAEVVMWLYEKHGIWMWVEKGVHPDNFYPVIQNHVSFKYSPKHWRDSIIEAYEEGIKYVLNNILG